MELIKKDNTFFLKFIIILCSFLVGGYHLAVSCAISVLLLLYMLYLALVAENKQKIQIGLTVLSIAVLTISYLVVSLWAVDSGTAIYGFFKILPVGLFALIVSSYDKTKRMEILECIPVTAAVNGVLAYGLSFIPVLSDYFLVAERLGGFFQSPNAFAIFCLAGIIILLTSEKLKAKHWVLTVVLMLLIFLTGSRTVFLFLVFTVVALVFTIKNKKVKRNVLLALLGIILASVVIVFITDSVQTVGRFLTISLESSTFLGRILYYRDAIPIILKNPFGLGYYGYYFSQGSFQTGVYSVAFVHNSVLQFLLDVGFVPAILFVSALAVSLFSKNSNLRQRLLLLVVFGHSLFDFDLEFTAVFFVVILAMNFERIKDWQLSYNKIAVSVASCVLILGSIYFGFINTLYLFGEYAAVEKIYGFDTMSKIQLITEEKDSDVLEKYADDIIKNNGCLAIAYDVKANSAYKKGDFKKVMEYKDSALDCAPYSLQEYTDYCEKMIVGISLYESAGDNYSADFCKKKLVSVKEKAEETKEKTSFLGWKIYDKPELDLPENYIKAIEACENNE